MSPFLQLIIALVIIITAAKVGGYLSSRTGQPAVLGELVLGILLGPSVLNLFNFPFFNDSHLPEAIHHMAEIGVLLLMFLAGLELHLPDLVRSSKVAGLAGGLGVLFPLAMGAGTGLLFAMKPESAIYIGLTLAATSVSISAQTLIELKVLRSRVGVSLLGAAVFDDILVLLLLAIFTALTQSASGAGLGEILLIIVKMAVFLGAASWVGWWIIPRLSKRISHMPISQGLVAFAIVVILFFGWSAEVLGHIAAITGAFLAGLWFGRVPEKERIHQGIAPIAYGLFVPIFFINIGLSADARQITWGTALLLLAMIAAAVVSKVLGSGWGALLGGFTKREALQLGVGMMSRGEVGLIVASIGVQNGLIDAAAFSAVVGVVILTTLLTPPLLRALYPKKSTTIETTVPTAQGD